ncbi:hypothetical protein BCR35DRAFT_303226 [Leucosporidium creatinivorum]|uniref:N-alpha-acetyltransferase 60 n=1 Tax=Leucosporidium creatinivorum TaxID=106004 RepID=A0A1Y2FKP4_9BASI|nr:hypothetical protein BCR35DRAFT_303226 [Leucosporidium creatinivorum]
MQFERWLPVNELPAVAFMAPTDSLLAGAGPLDFILPPTCSISALRRGFQPIPFHSPIAGRVPPSSVEEALTGRPAKRARREEKEITIRMLKRADVDAVSDLQDSNLPLSYPWSFYATLLTSSSSLCLIAVPSSSTSSATPPPVLGCISARLSPASLDDLSTTPTIHILSLVIAPSARRTGLARSLFKEVVRTLGGGAAAGKSQKEVQVILHVLASNTGAQAFYKKEGLEEVRRVRGHYRRLRDGENGEAVEMRGLVKL